LIADRATCLASRLTRRLALAATAALDAFAHFGFVDCFDVFQRNRLQKIIRADYITKNFFAKVISYVIMNKKI